MKKILLSADGDISVYSVPDNVADELDAYCQRFFKWLKEDTAAEKYRFVINGTACLRYDERDFIDYLNLSSGSEHSVLVETLDGISDIVNIPEKYRKLPYFNF